MIRDVAIGQYLPGNSFLHKMDARVKIVCTLTFIIAIFLCRNFWSLGLMVFAALCMTLISRVPFWQLLRSLRPVAFILLFLFGSTGFWLYIVLWIIAPKAQTPTEKCQLRGIEPSFENLSKFTTSK